MKDYFSFSRRDRIAILVLVLLIFLTLLLPYFFTNAIHTPSGETDTAWIALVKALQIKQDSEHLVHSRQKRYEKSTFSRQFSDSGTRWQNKRFTGPYYDSAGKWKARKFPDQKNHNHTGYRYVRRQYSPIDINTGDTTAFIALPGIGSRLAERIIRFREKLGGFYSIDQVAEVYGLADSVFRQIKPLLLLTATSVKKININTATLDELKAHPYIRYAIANGIIQYRNQHGMFVSIEDLKKIVLITGEIYSKIRPYLSLAY